ncbi:hypothetical protein BB560_005081 [Smittium megazygosporum]|uniref:TPR1-like CTLH-containing domain-containing protein n=1 Tax=Smittium megazygosporum TaxID=133381 RepID=A0A2T9Z7K7_9FUNG|nr:hypothetical protein BB560_005081 [Smittium megazygosporum]
MDNNHIKNEPSSNSGSISSQISPNSTPQDLANSKTQILYKRKRSNSEFSSEISDNRLHISALSQPKKNKPFSEVLLSINSDISNKMKLDPATKQENSPLSISDKGKPTPSENAVKRHSKYKEEEVIRLILQQLSDLGFNSSVEMLQKESGYILESPAIKAFKTDILEGNWDLAIEKLPLIPVKSKHKVLLITFQIKKQQYLEALFCGNLNLAIHLLQNEISTLSIQQSQIHCLSRLLMCNSIEDFLSKTNWTKNILESRRSLIDSLYEYMPRDLMLQPQRLQTLFDQSLAYQVSKCIYHSAEGKPSLYKDHTCKSKSQFAESPIYTLKDHTDEVWFVAFSHNGKFLASGSKDKSIIIWDTNKFKPVHTLRAHDKEISCLAWSPDDKILASASNDRTLKLWDCLTGECFKTLSGHNDFVTAVRWMPNGVNLISGSLDKKLILWNKNGTKAKEWTFSHIHDIAVTSDGSTIIIADNEKTISCFDLASESVTMKLKETDSILSIYLLKDDNHLLVGTTNYHLHLWDITSGQIIQSFMGFKLGAYVTRCSIGGINDSLVFCGSAG